MRLNLRSATGFTLIEILLVVVVVGIMATMAVFTIGGNENRNLANEAKRLHLLLVMAADESIFLGEEFGFFYTEENKYFLRYFNTKSMPAEWVDFGAKNNAKFNADAYEAFLEYQLPPFIEVHIELDDEYVGLKQISDEFAAQLQEEDELKPQIEEQLDQSDKDKEEEENKEEIETPDIELKSSGEVTPFKITLSLKPKELRGATYIIQSDGISPITLEMKSADEL